MFLHGVKQSWDISSQRCFSSSEKANNQQQAAEPWQSFSTSSPAQRATQGCSPKKGPGLENTPESCRQNKALPCWGKALRAGGAEDEEESPEEAAEAPHVPSLLQHWVLLCRGMCWLLLHGSSFSGDPAGRRAPLSVGGHCRRKF